MQSEHKGIEQFEIMSKLGEGAFGKVYKVRRKVDGEIYALKMIKVDHMKEKDRVNALNQIRILASHSGQNIISYKESFYEESSRTLCIVLQYAEQGDLLHKIQKYANKAKFIPQNEIWKALIEITKGLHSLHLCNILHRDVKPANIFITGDGTYKLGDLNVSKVLKCDLASTQVGTPYYASPQLWKDQPYNVKSDMWSLGCVIYEMASHKPPFMANDFPSLYKKVLIGKFCRIPKNYSDALFDLIKLLLSSDPKQRPSPTELLKNKKICSKYEGRITIDYKSENQLIETIQPSPNWKLISKNLPKSNYNYEKQLKTPHSKQSRNQSQSKQVCPKSIPRQQKRFSIEKNFSKEKNAIIIREEQKINRQDSKKIGKNSSRTRYHNKVRILSADKRKISIKLPQNQVKLVQGQHIIIRKVNSHENLPPPSIRSARKKDLPEPLTNPPLCCKKMNIYPLPPKPYLQSPKPKHIFNRKQSENPREYSYKRIRSENLLPNQQNMENKIIEEIKRQKR